MRQRKEGPLVIFFSFSFFSFFFILSVELFERRVKGREVRETGRGRELLTSQEEQQEEEPHLQLFKDRRCHATASVDVNQGNREETVTDVLEHTVGEPREKLSTAAAQSPEHSILQQAAPPQGPLGKIHARALWPFFAFQSRRETLMQSLLILAKNKKNQDRGKTGQEKPCYIYIPDSSLLHPNNYPPLAPLLVTLPLFTCSVYEWPCS